MLENYQITTIYSGGDDLFLIGAWDDIIEASVYINDKFKKFTLGKLTMSAGVECSVASIQFLKWLLRQDYLKKQLKLMKNQIALWVQEKYITGMSLKVYFRRKASRFTTGIFANR